jgi:hypothetical protein
MKHKLVAILSVFFLMVIPVRAQHGGGHGGGFGGGHSAGSGHSFGSVGHSIGHFFGAHSGTRGSHAGRGSAEMPPFAGAAMVHGHIVQLPGPGGRGVRPITPHRPLTVFGFPRRQGFFGFVDLGFCSPFEGFFTGYGFGADWGCVPGDFFFDPFFGSGYSPDFSGTPTSDEEMQAAFANSDPEGADDYHPDVIVEDESPTPADKVPHHRRSPREPDTILLLKDGAMYGLRDYWVTDDRLFYVTNYGGQNSVPLAQIDLAKTRQLNAERGDKFAVSSTASD